MHACMVPGEWSSMISTPPLLCNSQINQQALKLYLQIGQCYLLAMLSRKIILSDHKTPLSSNADAV